MIKKMKLHNKLKEKIHNKFYFNGNVKLKNKIQFCI